MNKKLFRDCGININFVTPEEMQKIEAKNNMATPLEKLKKIAERKARLCESCEEYPEWKYAETGLCFSCTTGESDASDDYELVSEK